MKKIIDSFVLVAVFALVAAATAKAETVYDPDCVLYYDFETLNSEGKVVNLVNPGTMDGTIVANNNLAPVLVADSPAERLRQSMTSAAYETSEKSLENYITSMSPDVRKNGYIECMPTDIYWFSKTNFTIECFFRTDNISQKFVPFFRQKGGGNVIANLGIGDVEQRVYANVSTNDQVFTRFGPFSAGEWHHAALVVNQLGETKQFYLYLDYKLGVTVDLLGNVTDQKIEDSGKWFIGGANGGNSFDGRIDSMRVTLRALEPDEFLSTKKFPVGRTLAHVKFDDGTVNADPDGATMTNGMNVAARAGGAAATFSDDVPGAIIRDGENGEVITKRNTKSISLSGSKVTWGSSSDDYGDTYFIRRTLTGDKRTSWTVEFWMKTTTTPNTWSRIITASNAEDLGSGYAYALTFWGSNILSLRGSNNDPTADSTVNVCDGKWHHIALTYAPNADYPDSKSDVKLYIDYGDEEGGHTYSRTTHLTSEPWNNQDPGGVGLVAYPDNLTFVLGMGSNPANTYNGLIDEFRISDGALEPSQFLRAERAPGFSIFIR